MNIYNFNYDGKIASGCLHLQNSNVPKSADLYRREQSYKNSLIRAMKYKKGMIVDSINTITIMKPDEIQFEVVVTQPPREEITEKFLWGKSKKSTSVTRANASKLKSVSVDP